MFFIAFVATFFVPLTANAEPGDAWTIQIWDAETTAHLHTVDEQVGYDGTVTEIVYDDVPSDGNCYAIVSISLAKYQATAEPLSIDSIKLRFAGSEYSPVTPAWSILRRHGYAVFTSGSVTNTSNGYIAFEIPSEYLDGDLSGAQVELGGFVSPEYSSAETGIPYAEGYVSSQATIERDMLSKYEAEGRATLDNPFVEVNPYGNAPLTAIAIFETTTPSNVQVVVQGKIKREILNTRWEAKLPIMRFPSTVSIPITKTG